MLSLGDSWGFKEIIKDFFKAETSTPEGKINLLSGLALLIFASAIDDLGCLNVPDSER